MRCQSCGFEDPDEYVYCSNCGVPRASGPDVSPAPGPSAAVAGPPIVPPRPAAPPRPIPPPRSPSPPPEPSPQRSRRARLAGEGGPVQGQEFALDQAELVIGRLSNCALPVADQ